MKKEKVSVDFDPRVALVDELYALHERLKPLMQPMKRYEALKKIIRGWAEVDKVHATKEASYRGKRALVVLGQRENERKIRSMQAVCNAVTPAKFVEHATITLKALEHLLPETSLSDLVVQEQTGSRPITILTI